MSFASGVRALADRSFYLKGFSKWGPVFKTTQFGAPVICVGGMERICLLMRGHASHLGPSPLAFTQSIMGNFLRYMDDGTHSKYGGIFRRAMAVEAPPEAENQLRSLARQTLEALAAAGAVNPGGALRKFARECLDLRLFGLTGVDDRSRKFGELADRFYSSSIGQALAHSDRRLLEEMESLLVEQLEDLGSSEKAFHPVISRIRALDPAMPDRVCLDNLVLMHKIATNNVSSLLQWLIFYWGTQPEVVSSILALPASDRGKALDAFLSETLRLSQSEYLYRKVAQDFEFEGYRFPRGWMVRSCIWESHRMTDAIEDPEDFRLRLAPGDYDRGHFSPFGIGRHACNGVDINHAICLAMLGEVASQFDVSVRNAEPFQRLMRHWSHWQPSRRMSILIEKRE
jgi:cytochrome P450